MILGIGLVSLATLFPIGLLRLREAQRQSRSAFLSESVSGRRGRPRSLLHHQLVRLRRPDERGVRASFVVFLGRQRTRTTTR